MHRIQRGLLTRATGLFLDARKHRETRGFLMFTGSIQKRTGAWNELNMSSCGMLSKSLENIFQDFPSRNVYPGDILWKIIREKPGRAFFRKTTYLPPAIKKQNKVTEVFKVNFS